LSESTQTTLNADVITNAVIQNWVKANQEWGLGSTVNPVRNIRKPNPGFGRDRRQMKE